MKSRLVLRISKKCLTSLGYVAKCPCGVVPFKTAAASTVADHSVALPMQVRPVGISREDDQMRIEIQKTLTPFQIKQRELNVELRLLKEAAKQVSKNKGEKSLEGAKAASEGRKQYKVTKKRVEGLLVDLERLFEDEKKKQV